MTAIQRDHEHKSQIEERKIRNDAASEEAKRKEKALQEEKIRQEKAKAELEVLTLHLLMTLIALIIDLYQLIKYMQNSCHLARFSTRTFVPKFFRQHDKVFYFRFHLMGEVWKGSSWKLFFFLINKRKNFIKIKRLGVSLLRKENWTQVTKEIDERDTAELWTSFRPGSYKKYE